VVLRTGLWRSFERSRRTIRRDPAARRPPAANLTADNQMTRKPNLALNAEIESSGRAANSARCARAFLSLRPNRDRVGLRQPRCLPDDGPDVGGGVLNHQADILARTELEANLDAAGALERYQYWSDKLKRLLQQQRSRAAMTVTSRNLQVITGRAAREGARERVCFAQKPIAATKMATWRNLVRNH
jgi:hypothetical protein